MKNSSGLVLCLVASLSCVAGAARADVGEGYYLPQKSGPTRSGLRLFADTYGVTAHGYRPIRLELSTANGKPAPVDRSLQLSFEPDKRDAQFIVTQTLSLPRGKTSVKTTVYVPQHWHWDYLYLDAKEKGKLLDDLSGRMDPNSRSVNWSMEEFAVLVIHSEVLTAKQRVGDRSVDRLAKDPLPSIQGIPEILDSNQSYPGLLGFKPLDPDFLNGFCVAVTARPITELEENWLAYTCYSLVIITADDFESLAKQQLNKMEALRRWIESGGNLAVLGVDDARQLGRLSLSLGLTAGDSQDLESLRKLWGTLGNVVSVPGRYSDSPVYEDDYGMVELVEKVNETSEESAENAKETTKKLAELDKKLLATSRGAGKVVVFEKPLATETSRDWARVVNYLQEDINYSESEWSARHGFEPMTPVYSFWEFQIPGVGRAPVVLFCMLITVFAIVIGPVNYLFLAKLGRLNWMLITVPAGAGLMVTCLFLYAVLSQGFGNQVRLRSVTWLDQRAETSATWSRQVYFSGIAPSSGLLFPRDTAVYSHNKPGLNPTKILHRLNWSAENQQLARGYLNSRDPAQFLVLQTVAQERRRISVRWQDRVPIVKNQLGVTLTAILVKDEKGISWEFPALEPGEEGRGTEAKKYGGWLVEWEGWKADSLGNSLMEDEFNPMAALSRPEKSFLAITDDPTGLPLGLENPQFKGSVHLFAGRY